MKPLIEVNIEAFDRSIAFLTPRARDTRAVRHLRADYAALAVGLHDDLHALPQMEAAAGGGLVVGTLPVALDPMHIVEPNGLQWARNMSYVHRHYAAHHRLPLVSPHRHMTPNPAAWLLHLRHEQDLTPRQRENIDRYIPCWQLAPREVEWWRNLRRARRFVELRHRLPIATENDDDRPVLGPWVRAHVLTASLGTHTQDQWEAAQHVLWRTGRL
ncbi:hypothetical protein [Leucobacter chromiireducens]|uniref:hypothetical protein n=1 Tax=Leucobacter chromiireducens TaxID=283877 RepID=UPI001F38FB12|nr:hypothetical protein [Leucobacter chromiireducens]